MVKIICFILLLISCNNKGSLFKNCNNINTVLDLQPYKDASNLFEISLPENWHKEIKYDGRYVSIFSIDTTNQDVINTFGINIKKTNYSLEKFYTSELNEMKKEYPIVESGKNLISNEDLWVINKEKIRDFEVVNLFIYLVENEKAYIIHITSNEGLCIFLPILKSFSLRKPMPISS